MGEVYRGPVRVVPRYLLAGLLSCVVAITGCSTRLPTAPSNTPLTAGVAIYQHAGFEGESALLRDSLSSLLNVVGPCRSSDVFTDVFDDCISSIRVAPGWAATLHEDEDFRGRSLVVTEDIPDLSQIEGPCQKGGFNDCVSSVRVYRR